MTEENKRTNEEITEVENAIELEGFTDVPCIRIENVNIRNLYVTVNMSHCFGGSDDE